MYNCKNEGSENSIFRVDQDLTPVQEECGIWTDDMHKNMYPFEKVPVNQSVTSFKRTEKRSTSNHIKSQIIKDYYLFP